MNITKKCDLCDTVLEFEDGGHRIAFKAHDEAFCRGATQLRIRALERALEQSAQNCGLTEARYRAALHRNDIETRILRDALARAAQPSVNDEDLRDLEWTLENLDQIVEKELRARMDEARLKYALAAAELPARP